jgi:hypothetical protein
MSWIIWTANTVILGLSMPFRHDEKINRHRAKAQRYRSMVNFPRWSEGTTTSKNQIFGHKKNEGEATSANEVEQGVSPTKVGEK